MFIYGGMNDFYHTQGDLIVYDLEKDIWIDDIKYGQKKAIYPPPISHASAATIFYEQRHHYEKMLSFYNLEDIDWSRVKHYYKEEGFYLFGGFL